MELKVSNLRILKSKFGVDQLIFDTELPNGLWPFEGNATIKMDVAHNTGEEYRRNNLIEMDYKIIEV